MATRGSDLWRRTHWGDPPPLRPDLSVVQVGRASVKVEARAVDAFAALDAVFTRYRYTVNPAYPEGDTGTYNRRHIGNDPSRPWSAHAWGIAIDVNWRQNPDGSRLVTDIPRDCVDAIHAIRTNSGAPVWRWGGDWDRDPRTGHSYYDAMHFELIATPAELATGIDWSTVDGARPDGGITMLTPCKYDDRDSAAVEALQTYLRYTLGIDIGTWGPAKDGVDLHFGGDTAKGLAKALGKSGEQKTFGVRQWATLMKRHHMGGAVEHTHSAYLTQAAADGRYAKKHGHPYAPAAHDHGGVPEHEHTEVVFR